MNIEFPDKTVIVTGAAHGFGRAIALAFAAARRQCLGLRPDRSTRLAETARLCREAGGHCTVRTVDVTDRDAVFAFVREAEASPAAGQVHILVNNAGGVLGQVGRPLEECRPRSSGTASSPSTCRGAFFFAQAVAPAMKEAKYGRIVNISSGAGLGPA